MARSTKERRARRSADRARGAAQAATENPYVRRLIEDAELRDNIRSAYQSARSAYGRVSNGKGPAKALLDDKKVHKDLRNAAERLSTWRNAVESRIAKGQGQEWQGPPAREPPINVPPLHGRERLQRMILVAWVLLGVLIPAATFYLLSPK